MNPKQHGKTMGCFNCGALTHLVKNCPEKSLTLVVDSPEEVAELTQLQDVLNVKINNRTSDKSQHATIPDDDSMVDKFSKAMATLDEDNHRDVGYVTLDCLYAIDVYINKSSEIPGTEFENVMTLDTGCVSTVTGKKCVDAIIKMMPERAKKMIKVSKSEKRFRFGGGEKRKSLGHFAIPISIGNGHNIILYTDVVEAPIPCLISKAAIKQARGIINTKDDTITIFDNVKIPLVTVKAGHYGIPIGKFQFRDGQEVNFGPTKESKLDSLEDENWEVFAVEQDTLIELPDAEEDDQQEVEKKIRRMHEQLGHPSKPTFVKMLKTSAIMSDEPSGIVYDFINKLYESCPTCIQFTKSKPRPRVSPPLATRFNQTVSVDLKVWPKYNVVILYIVDNFSRFIQGHIIPDKKPESVIKVLMDEWILKLFGAMDAIQMDNGGEFMNAKMKEMCEKFGIKFISTGAESPWQNGLVEKNHMMVDGIIEKMKVDNPKRTVRELLPQAIFAKNSLINVYGYVPLQIVFGHIPRIPGVPYNEPPANETVVQTEVIANRLQNLYSAREAYMKVENSARLKKALNSKIPAPKIINYFHGQKVYYKHGPTNTWHGPAEVVATSNKVIFIRQGRFLLATSQTRIIPKERYEDMSEQESSPLSKISPEQESPVTPDLNMNQKFKRTSTRQSNRIRGKDPKDSDDSDSDSDADTETRRPPPPQPPTPPTPPPLPRTPPPPPSTQNSILTPQNPAFDLQQNLSSSDLEEDFTTPQQSSKPQQTSTPNISPSKRPTLSPYTPTLSQPSPTPASCSDSSLETSGESGRSSETSFEKRLDRDIAKMPIHRDELEPFDDTIIEPLQKFRRPDKNVKTKLKTGVTIWVRAKSQRHNKDAWYQIKLIQRTSKSSRDKKTGKNNGPHWNVERLSDQHKIGWYEWSHDYYTDGEDKPDWVKNYITYVDSDDEELPSEYNDFDDFDITLVTFIPTWQHRSPKVIKAKEKELKNFLDYNAYKWVKDTGQPRCSVGWVVTVKDMGAGELGVKARLVVHGNQLGEDVDSDSPTVRKMTLRIMITLAVQYGWKVHSGDVTAAFLQSTVMTRVVHVRPPPEVTRRGQLWLLLRPMYGLDEAGRCWYMTVDNYLVQELGGTKTTADPACWVFHHKARFIGFLCLHVDDAMFAGTDKFHETIIKPLFEKFKFGKTAEGDFKLLGWNIESTRDGEVKVNQRDYIENKLQEWHPKKDPKDRKHHLLPEDKKKTLRALVGGLRWVTDQTRPDVSFPCLHLNCMGNNPTFREIDIYNNAVRNLKENNFQTYFRKLKPDKWVISVFADASHNNLPPAGTGTGGGHVIFLGNGWTRAEDRTEETETRKRCNILSWKCTKLSQACASTTEAETIALANALVEADVVKEIICEATLMDPSNIDIQAFCDNRNVVFNCKSTMMKDTVLPFRSYTKKIRDFLNSGRVFDVKEISGGEQVADCLTKLRPGTVDIVDIIRKGQFFS